MNVFYVIFGYNFNEFIRKFKNNDHTCLFQCINIIRLSRKQFEKTCMIPIIVSSG